MSDSTAGNPEESAASSSRRDNAAATKAKLSQVRSGKERWLGDLPLGPVPSEPARLEKQMWLGDLPLGPGSSKPDEPTWSTEPDEAPTGPDEPDDASALVASTDGDEGYEAATGLGEAEEPSPKGPGRARRFVVDNFVAVIVGVVALGLAVALALAMVQLGNKSATDNAGATALTAAKSYSIELAAYDYRQLDKDFGVVLAHSTPSFRRSFTQSSDALKSTLTKYHATSKAKVVAAGLISASTSRAVALVFLDQTVTNSTQKGATTDRSQVEITLVYTGGHWLIDQVTLL